MHIQIHFFKHVNAGLEPVAEQIQLATLHEHLHVANHLLGQQHH